MLLNQVRQKASVTNMARTTEIIPLNQTAGRPIPDWPKLLHLYSRLKSGKTVLDWMEAYEVHSLGIDVRRFTSFGVIKVRFPVRFTRITTYIIPPGLPSESPPLAHSPPFKHHQLSHPTPGRLYPRPTTRRQLPRNLPSLPQF